MLVYFIALALSILFCVLHNHATKKSLKILFAILSCLPFFLVTAFRGNSVGIDTWNNYSPIYNNIASYGENFDTFSWLQAKYEPGFSLIIISLASIFKDPTMLFIFGAGIITFFTFSAIYKQSKKPLLSILIYFLSGAILLGMNGMRGYMSLAIVLYTLQFVQQRKLLPFVIFIILASLIHKSSLPFILLYPLWNLVIKPKYALIATIATVPLLPIIYNLFAIFLQGSDSTYSNYFQGNSIVNPTISMLIINVFLLAFFAVNFKNHQKDKLYNLFLKLQVISVIVCILSFKIPLAFRMEQIIDFFQILSIPYNLYLIQKHPPKKSKANIYYILLAAVIAMFSAYFVNTFILNDDNQVRNYKTVFEEGEGHANS